MDKIVVLYTMKSCPLCHILKEMLEKEELPFIDRDIDEYPEEYDLFTKATSNEYVPSFMTIESTEESPVSKLFAPERDFDEITDGLQIIREFYQQKSPL